MTSRYIIKHARPDSGTNRASPDRTTFEPSGVDHETVRLSESYLYSSV